MAFMYICSASVLVCFFGMLYILLIFVMIIWYMIPRVFAVNTNIGSIFQPLALMSFVRFSYFFVVSTH